MDLEGRGVYTPTVIVLLNDCAAELPSDCLFVLLSILVRNNLFFQ